jgi:hypothetical protein
MAKVNLEDFVCDQYGEVKILTNAIGLFVLDGLNLYTIPGWTRFLEFLKDRNIAYYARPSESFCIHDAVKQANDANQTYLITEYLS